MCLQLFQFVHKHVRYLFGTILSLSATRASPDGAGICQQQRDVGVGGGSGGDVVAAVEMMNVVNVQVVCCRCTVTLECDDALSCLIVTAHRHARL